MFDVFYLGKKPNLFAFERPASDLDDAARQSRTSHYWFIYSGYNYSQIDFDYVPVPWETAHVHVWPSQWHQYGGVYLANRHTVKNREWNFHREIVRSLPNEDNWNTLVPIEKFDYSWRPHPYDPPYIYVFGNQWHSGERMPTVEYVVKGATEHKYIHEPQAVLPQTQDNWTVYEDAELDFDFSWCPDPYDPPYIYVFGNQHWEAERSATIEYTVPGATERKYVGEIRAELGELDIFFIDRGNEKSQVRFDMLSVGHKVTRVRYANSMFETIQRCVNRATTSRFWVVSSDYNYEEFDFAWHPEPWQQSMTHVFASQHNKWSDTFLINKWEFERHARWATSLEQFPNLNFVDGLQVRKLEPTADIYYVDHANPESDNNYNYLKVAVGEAIRTRFVGEYLDVLKRIVNTAETEYVWVVSSLCRYSYFDFTWEPEPWQREMIHCFASDGQRRGDTFYIHIESFKRQMIELELLDWFNVINYVDGDIERYPTPVHYYQGDDLITEIKNYDFKTPYVTFTNQPDLRLILKNCLWSAKDCTIVRASRSGATCIVPRDVKQYLKTQLYDYPYIDQHGYFVREYDQDIVFISYDEPQADENWDAIRARFGERVKRIHGVEGMHNALLAAANASTTPWYYAVFAKTQIHPDFKFKFMPDYFQAPKHYIFHAHNPLNGLEYGHMGVVLYNCNIVRNQTTFGIDYTMSAAHEVVPEVSAIAHFNSNPYQTWRTAFREAAKLSQFCDESPTVETEYRLQVWTSQAQGEYAEWCLQGARDGVEFYRKHKGKPAELKQAFDWNWLKSYFNSLYISFEQPDLDSLAQRQALVQR